MPSKFLFRSLIRGYLVNIITRVDVCHPDNDWPCLHPVLHSRLNDHLVGSSFNMLWYSLIAWDVCHLPPVVPSTLFPLVCICVLVSPSLCKMLPICLNLVTCGSWADCILTHTNDVPFNTCTLSLLMTLSFLSSPRLPSTAPVPHPERLSPLRTAPHHPRTSSDKVLIF